MNASIDNLAQAANRARRILIKMLDRRDRGVLARASMWARRASVVSGRNPGGGAARLAPAAKNRVFSHVPDLCAPLLWENAPCGRWCDLTPEKTAGQKLTKSYFFLFGALRGAHKSGTWCFSALFDDASAHNSRTCPRFGFRALRKGCWGEGRRRLPFIALASPIAAPVSGGARCDGLPMRPSPVRTSCPGRWPPAARRVRIRSSFELVPK